MVEYEAYIFSLKAAIDLGIKSHETRILCDLLVHILVDLKLGFEFAHGFLEYQCFCEFHTSSWTHKIAHTKFQALNHIFDQSIG